MKIIFYIFLVILVTFIYKCFYSYIQKCIRKHKLEKANSFLSTIKNGVSKKYIDNLFGFNGKWVADVYSPYKTLNKEYDTYSSYIWKEDDLIFSFMFCNDKLYSKKVSMKGN